MLILTILLSLALAALFTLLPARIHRRRPVRADLYAGAGVSALVWLWAVCVWSKPGLSVGFDAFRLAAILIMQAIACGVVCGSGCAVHCRESSAPRRLSDCCWPPALE